MRWGAFMALALALAAASARAGDCPSCSFKSLEGITNCWSCGTRMPGSEDPRKLAPVNLIVVDVLARKKAEAPSRAARNTSAEVEAVEKWIDANEDDYAGAIARLDPLLDAVRGTVYEARVEDRIARIRAAVEAVSQPMTAEEREKKAASMVIKVAARVRKRADRPEENVRDLEQLLAMAKGTSYEAYVRRLLKSEKSKLKR